MNQPIATSIKPTISSKKNFHFSIRCCRCGTDHTHHCMAYQIHARKKYLGLWYFWLFACRFFSFSSICFSAFLAPPFLADCFLLVQLNAIAPEYIFFSLSLRSLPLHNNRSPDRMRPCVHVWLFNVVIFCISFIAVFASARARCVRARSNAKISSYVRTSDKKVSTNKKKNEK